MKASKKFIVAVLVLSACAAAVCAYLFYFAPMKKFDSATELAESGKYEEARALFVELDGFGESAEMICECDYLSAVKLFESENYAEAAARFELLDDYKDSKEKLTESNYLAAEKYCSKGKYEEALKFYEAAGDYRESYDRRFEVIIKYYKELAGNGYFTDADLVLDKIFDIPDRDDEFTKSEIDEIKKTGKKLNFQWLFAAFSLSKRTADEAVIEMLTEFRYEAKKADNYNMAIKTLYDGRIYYNVGGGETVFRKDRAAGLKKLIDLSDETMLTEYKIINLVDENQSYEPYRKFHKLLKDGYEAYKAYSDYIYSVNYDSPEEFKEKANALLKEYLPYLELIEKEYNSMNMG